MCDLRRSCSFGTIIIYQMAVVEGIDITFFLIGPGDSCFSEKVVRACATTHNGFQKIV